MGLTIPALLFPTSSNLSAEVLAQSNSDRKTEADRLLQRGISSLILNLRGQNAILDLVPPFSKNGL